MTRTAEPAIQNYRFGAFLTQALPLVGIKAGASLHALMLIYSLSFVLLHFGVFAFCGLALKAWRPALILLIANALFATDTFYWIQSELPQGLALSVLLFAFAERASGRFGTAFAACAVALTPVVAFMHPLLIFPVMFWIAYRLLDRASPRLLILVALAYLLSVAVKTFFFKTAYDSSAFEGLKNFREHFPNYFRNYANKRLLLRCLGPYVLLPVAFVGVVWWQARKKNWLKLALVGLSVLGYGLLINVSYPNKETTAFYIENMYLPIGLMLGVPLVYDILPRHLGKGRTSWIALAVVLFALIRIGGAHRPYAQRLAWLRNAVFQKLSEKRILPASQTPQELLLMDWGIPYEAWLLSTSERNTSASLLVASDPEKFSGEMGNTEHFLTPWGSHSYASLPTQYFMFRNTSAGYYVDSTQTPAHRWTQPPKPE